MLTVRHLTKHFGGVTALKELSFEVSENELLGVIGPNGSGKTTLINLIDGLHKPDTGTVRFRDRRIDRLPPFEIAKRGIGRTFQVTRTFRRMSVLENLMVPALSVSRTEDRQFLRYKALETLDFLKLTRLRDEYGRNLSGGQQKLLELGRVLMLDPALILLDEPFAGVHPELKGELHDHIRSLHRDGKTFILISHDMHSVFALCKRLIVLSSGQKIADGDPEAVRRDERVIEAYLGD